MRPECRDRYQNSAKMCVRSKVLCPCDLVCIWALQAQPLVELSSAVIPELGWVTGATCDSNSHQTNRITHHQ